MSDSDSGSMGFTGKRGFLALPREASPANPNGWFPGEWELAHLYIDLAMEANWADAKTPLPKQKITLKQGQLVLDTRCWPNEHGLSRQRFKTLVRRLAFLGKINPQANPLGTIITINDYAEIFLTRPVGQPTDQPTTNPLPTHYQPNQDIKDKRDPVTTGGPLHETHAHTRACALIADRPALGPPAAQPASRSAEPQYIGQLREGEAPSRPADIPAPEVIPVAVKPPSRRNVLARHQDIIDKIRGHARAGRVEVAQRERPAMGIIDPTIFDIDVSQTRQQQQVADS